MHSPPQIAHILPSSFYDRDAPAVARELLGKVLVSTIGRAVTSGRIVETEAYLGSEDPGSHAATKGITKRNAVMYGPPGRAYVYFTYGNHHMLNLVTCENGVAGAVLIRALEPIEGVETMEWRRAAARRGVTPPAARELTNGPGKLAAAIGVTLEHNGGALDGSGELAVLDAPPPAEAVATSGRIGLTEGHALELRYYLEGNSYVSRGRVGAKSRADGKGGRA